MGPPLSDHLLVHVFIEGIHDQPNEFLSSHLSSYLVVFNLSADICDGLPIN